MGREGGSRHKQKQEWREGEGGRGNPYCVMVKGVSNSLQPRKESNVTLYYRVCKTSKWGLTFEQCFNRVQH